MAIWSGAFRVGHPAIQSRAFREGSNIRDNIGAMVFIQVLCRYLGKSSSDSNVSFWLVVRS